MTLPSSEKNFYHLRVPFVGAKFTFSFAFWSIYTAQSRITIATITFYEVTFSIYEYRIIRTKLSVLATSSAGQTDPPPSDNCTMQKAQATEKIKYQSTEPIKRRQNLQADTTMTCVNTVLRASACKHVIPSRMKFT